MTLGAARHASCVVVIVSRAGGNDVSSSGGDWRPVYVFARSGRADESG